MRNHETIKNINDAVLARAVLEIKEWHDTGVLVDGVCRALANEIKEDHLRIVEDVILMEASLRFAKRWCELVV